MWAEGDLLRILFGEKSGRGCLGWTERRKNVRYLKKTSRREGGDLGGGKGGTFQGLRKLWADNSRKKKNDSFRVGGEKTATEDWQAILAKGGKNFHSKRRARCQRGIGKRVAPTGEGPLRESLERGRPMGTCVSKNMTGNEISQSIDQKALQAYGNGAGRGGRAL